MKLNRLARARGVVAALLVFVASSATSTVSAVASRARPDDSAIHAAPAFHAPVAHRVADEQRSTRRHPPVADLPFAENGRGAIADVRASAPAAGVERTVVARPVPRAYDATAPPTS